MSEEDVGHAATENSRGDFQLVPPGCTVRTEDLEVEVYAPQKADGTKGPSVAVLLKHKPTGRGAWSFAYTTVEQNFRAALQRLQEDGDYHNWTKLEPPREPDESAPAKMRFIPLSPMPKGFVPPPFEGEEPSKP